MQYLGSLGIPMPILFFLFLWSFFWKGLALWHASARNKQRNWFVVMLIVNTFGILELLYLFRFSEKKFTLVMLQVWK